MGFVGIVASSLVSGSYYNGRGASDIDALKTRKSTWLYVCTVYTSSAILTAQSICDVALFCAQGVAVVLSRAVALL